MFEMELFVATVNCLQPLIIVTKSSISDIAVALDMSFVNAFV